MRIKSFLLISALILASGLSVAQTEMNRTLETIFNRSSIRSYSDKQVEKDQIMTLLRAGMSAPSAVNKQPWAFVVIDDKALMEKNRRRIEKCRYDKESIVCNSCLR